MYKPNLLTHICSLEPTIPNQIYWTKFPKLKLKKQIYKINSTKQNFWNIKNQIYWTKSIKLKPTKLSQKFFFLEITSLRYSRMWSQSVLYGRLFFIDCPLPSNIIFHQRWFFFLGCLQPKSIYHKRLSSIKGCHP